MSVCVCVCVRSMYKAVWEFIKYAVAGGHTLYVCACVSIHSRCVQVLGQSDFLITA